jgi:hypothetical protein
MTVMTCDILMANNLSAPKLLTLMSFATDSRLTQKVIML